MVEIPEAMVEIPGPAEVPAPEEDLPLEPISAADQD